MFFSTNSAVLVGITPVLVTVEVDINTRSVKRLSLIHISEPTRPY